jgi:hypothetical protein
MFLYEWHFVLLLPRVISLILFYNSNKNSDVLKSLKTSSTGFFSADNQCIIHSSCHMLQSNPGIFVPES